MVAESFDTRDEDRCTLRTPPRDSTGESVEEHMVGDVEHRLPELNPRGRSQPQHGELSKAKTDEDARFQETASDVEGWLPTELSTAGSS